MKEGFFVAVGKRMIFDGQVNQMRRFFFSGFIQLLAVKCLIKIADNASELTAGVIAKEIA